MNSPSPPAVCIIIENLPAPMDRRVWQESRALRDAGYRVSVICPKRGEFTLAYEKLEGIEIYRYPLHEARGPLGYLVEYTWALAAQFILAVKVYHRTRFRIIQACNPPDTIFLVALFFKLFGVKFLFDHHDLNPELFEAKFGKRSGLLYRLVCLAERMTYRAADVSIATNESYRAVALKRGGMKSERVFVVRSAPDPALLFTKPPDPALKQGKKFLIAYLGVMGAQEGLDLLLEALRLVVAKRGPDEVGCVLMGGGPELPHLTKLAHEMGLDSVVRFTGRVTDADLATTLSTADVCVAPDPKNPMNDQSTMNKVLEYMAFGRPVVMFDLTEGRRSAGGAALYARSNDPADFAAQILTLLNSDALREKLGQAGRGRIETTLNWATEKEQLLKAYELVMKG
ncbi:MAG TPA: glycosyltransferase family 4 protein [Terriglobia bacterium]|nr:glycosyltransferase family 4 protein [Terriglobia bacterium]